ncbi:hypothetical protein [Nocardia sp. NBC_00511]|uniref:hypothetical protein n=1 Tax=Nocardia sp. NBC_00511 TaxID=2903591 RepID=UPI0030E3535D
MPLREAALAARLQIHDVLTEWTDMVVDERGLRHRPQRAVPVLANFLDSHFDWLSTHFAVGDFADELHEALSVGRCAAESTAGPRSGAVRPCATPGCSGHVVMRRSGQTDASSVELSCTAGHLWTPETGTHVVPETVPTRDAAWLAGVTEDTIRQWVRRGKLTRYGTSRRAEFDLTEVLRLISQ